ncbi:MAG: FAD-binding protein [Gemmatimonadaceae bacterium]
MLTSHKRPAAYEPPAAAGKRALKSANAKPSRKSRQARKPAPPDTRWRRVRRRVGRATLWTVGPLALVVVWTTVLGLARSDGVALAAPAEPTLVRDVTRLTAVRMGRVAAPRTVEELAAAVRGSTGPVSIGGGRYSMGGQTATPDGLQIDMRQLHGVVSIDTVARTVTVRAGTPWRELQEAIDPKGLAVQVMQTYNTFTVGGALSVNAHGRYIGHGPVSSTVRALKLVLADGSVVTASRTERPELFWAALGGYGAVGVIAEATLSLAENVRVRREDEVMPVASYLAWFRRNVRSDSTVIFHNADISPGGYDEVRAVTYRRTTEPLTTAEHIRPKDQSGWVTPTAFRIFSTPGIGPWARRNVIEPLAYRVGARNPVTWRNYEASYDVSELEPSSRLHDTYVLQEYFLPVDSLIPFVRSMGAILHDSSVKTVNVSIRHANAEPEPYLSWAPGETFAFVLYYRQPTGSDEMRRTGRWTRALVDAALRHGGRYYLPYQPHMTRAEFVRAYPRAGELFAVKRKVDPQHRFTNVLWDLYAPAPGADTVASVTAARLPSFLPAEVRLATDTLPGYARAESSTWSTHPEWDLVYSSEQYAEWLSAGRRPSAFPYSATVGTFWRSYYGIWRWTRARGEFTGRTHLMLGVIGTSTALEYGLKSIYEGTVGRLFEWTGPDGMTPEERVAARVNSDYARFIAIRPWYEFDYVAARRALWASADEPGRGLARRLERRAILTLEFTLKGWYARLIGGGTHAAYAPDADARWLLVAGAADSARIPGALRIVPLDRGYRAVLVPRYAGVRDALVALAADPAASRAVELAGNERVAITGTAPLAWRAPAGMTPILAYRVPVDATRMRVVADVPVMDLVRLLAAERARPAGLRVDHVYDY